jgi:hypothetical protein
MNVANQCWDVHDLIFMHGVVRLVIPLCKTSNTPALVAAAVALLCSMSYRERSRSKLIKAGAVRVLDPIARTERVDLNSVSAEIARTNLRRHAASVMTALAKGFLDRKRLRKEAHNKKMRRLGNFFGNLVFYKCLLMWMHLTRTEIDHRNKLQIAVRRLVNGALLRAFHRMIQYVERRHVKYGKLEVAIAFSSKSVLARNCMLRMWKEYMHKHGSWWAPDASMEEQIAKRCASFVALMAGHWSTLCFQAWKELLVKKKRAMKRWQNSAIYNALTCWTEYMYTEGSWWEPDGELKRELDQKCGKFLAAISGNYLQMAFSEWSVMVKKKKRATQRWFNRCLTNTFDQWHDVVFVDTYEMYMQVEAKCGHVRALISGEFCSMCFRWWCEYAAMSRKSKRFLSSIKNRPLRVGWESWLDLMFQGSWWQPDDDVQAQLQLKCGHLIAMISGDFTRAAMQQWNIIAQKNRKAMRRWKNQSLHHSWKGWVQFHEWKSADLRRAGIIRSKRRLAELQDNVWEWMSCVDERRYRRSLVGDAILMWLNFRQIWAFRTLDEFCQTQKYHRQVLLRFKTRYKMRPAYRGLVIWSVQVERQIRLRMLVHRIKNNCLVTAIGQWHDTMHEVRNSLSPLCAAVPCHDCYSCIRKYMQIQTHVHIRPHVCALALRMNRDER